MKRVLIVLGLSVFLGGCQLFTATETRTETVYKAVLPPEYLTAPCYPERPERASLRDIIEIQDRAIDQCNNQLMSIRQWVDLETQRLEEEKEEDNED